MSAPKPRAPRPPRVAPVAGSLDPIVFEAALAIRGKCFSLDSEGEAQLVLEVPEQFARVLSDNIHRLRDCSFVVRIERVQAGDAGRAQGKRRA